MRLQPKRARQFVKGAKLLLENGADPNSFYLETANDPNSVHETALYGAAGVANNPALAKLLLDAGANPQTSFFVDTGADEKQLLYNLVGRWYPADEIAPLL